MRRPLARLIEPTEQRPHAGALFAIASPHFRCNDLTRVADGRRVTSRPHDALFRSAFEHPEHAAGELRHVLPSVLVSAIDWTTLSAEPGSFVDIELTDRHSDILFSAALGRERALIYLLLEHQSTADPIMPLRILVYVTRIWERCIREAPERALPAVIPVVISHAVGGWTAPKRMHELVRPEPSSLGGLASLVPEFRIVVDDLAHASDEDLRARTMAMFPTVALWLLRDGRDPEALLANLADWASAFHAVASAPNGFEALTRLLRYLDLVLPERKFEQFRGKLIELAPSTEKATMTYGERMTEEGRQEGRQEGRRAMLRDLLEAKFGALGEPAVAELASADEDALQRWAKRLLVAARLEDVFER